MAVIYCDGRTHTPIPNDLLLRLDVECKKEVRGYETGWGAFLSLRDAAEAIARYARYAREAGLEGEK